MTRREAARLAGEAIIDPDFAARGAVGCAWSSTGTGWQKRVGIRMPNPIDPGKFYRIEFGGGWNYDEAVAAARFKVAHRGREWSDDERRAWGWRQPPSSDYLS